MASENQSSSTSTVGEAEGLLGKRREQWQAFSIVIPAHNEQNYLPQTLDALAEAFEVLEFAGKIIVVDDDSADETRAIALSRGAQVIAVSLRNIGAVRNAGAKVCETPWLFFLDADTTLPAATLAAALDQLSTGAAGGGAAVEIAPTRPISILKWLLFYMMKLCWQHLGGWAAGCFMFCRREIFEDFGGFNEEFFAAEELFFSRSVARRGKFRVLREPVLTSARKLESYSTVELLRFVTLPILRPKLLLKSKFGLEVLYDDEKSR